MASSVYRKMEPEMATVLTAVMTSACFTLLNEHATAAFEGERGRGESVCVGQLQARLLSMRPPPRECH